MKNFKNLLPQIVIIGAGAAGLPLATRLGDHLGKQQAARITLINPTLTSLWKPLWHEVAAGTLSTQEDELNLVAHAYHHHFNFLLGSLQSINRAHQQVYLSPLLSNGKEILPGRHVDYTLLVIAIGSHTADFGVPGVKEHCFRLDTLQEAHAFQQEFLTQFIISQDPKRSERTDPLRIAIVGAGATGIELAAELHFAAAQAGYYGFAKTQTRKIASISIIEAGETILKGLPEKIVKDVTQEFKQKEIKIFTHTKVTKVVQEGFQTSEQFIPADLKIWAVGLKAPDLLRGLEGLETNSLNQLIVKSTLQTTQDQNIFALGDCAACFQKQNNTFVPLRAQAAQQQADLLSRSLINYLQHDKPLREYFYRDYGTFISLSQKTVFGHIKGKKGSHYFLKGYLAHFSYRFLYRRYQSILHGWWRVILLTIANWLSKPVRPRLKLN